MTPFSPPSRYEPGALVGGEVIPLAVPTLRGNEGRYLQECVATNWVSSVGPFVNRFERMAAEYVGAKHAVAMASGTAALHMALLVAGVEPGDEVVTSTLTFIAPANAIRYAGAAPVFIDAEPAHWQIDVDRVADFLGRECERRDGALRNRATGRRVRAILPVHILGHPVDLDPLAALAARYDLALVEDAAESLGARYAAGSAVPCSFKDRSEEVRTAGPTARRVGHLGATSGQLAGQPALSVLSFNGNKVITAGGGGMLLTDDDRLAARARYLATQAKDDPLEYVHHEVGFNYRLTNLQAAVGVAQMEQLDEFVAIKRGIAARYDEALAGVAGLTPMREAPWAFSTFWLYTVLIDESRFGMASRELLRILAAAKIQTRPLWQPMHLSKAHAGSPGGGGDVAAKLHRDALSLPCSVGLSDAEQMRVIETIVAAAVGDRKE